MKDCRKKFRPPLQFDPSEENYITRGNGMCVLPTIEYDNNGFYYHHVRRNFPKTLQWPSYTTLYYSTNNDTHRILINATSSSTIKELGGRDRYDNTKYLNNIIKVKKGGLKYFNGVCICTDYIYSYVCKGREHSTNWKVCSKAVTYQYCMGCENEYKTLRSLIEKHTNEVTSY